MGSSHPAIYDALSTESGVVSYCAPPWSEARMTGAATRIRGAGPTITSTGGHGRSESYIRAELAR
jgi:hypothetical protein